MMHEHQNDISKVNKQTQYIYCFCSRFFFMSLESLNSVTNWKDTILFQTGNEKVSLKLHVT